MYAPSLEIELDPVGPLYRIHQDDRMPQITARAKILNPPDELAGWDKRPYPPGLTYQWDVSLVMQPGRIPHTHGRITSHPRIWTRTFGPEFVIPFTKIRGGDLNISVTVSGSGLKEPLRAKTRGLKVLGNASSLTEQTLYAAGASELMVKIIRHESAMRQFHDSGPWAGYPLFSADNLGGVGLTQLTNPHPNDDEVWSWRANLAKGMHVLLDKLSSAKRYLENYPNSAEFQTYANNYNNERLRLLLASPTKSTLHATGPLKITISAPSKQMIEREAIRAYNGYGYGINNPYHKGKLHLREFIANVDTSNPRLPKLVVQEVDASNGTATWHENTGAERKAWYEKNSLPVSGDPDYVQNVLGETIGNP